MKTKKKNEYRKPAVFSIASNKLNNSFITVNSWRRNERRLDKHVGKVGSGVSIEPLYFILSAAESHEGGAGQNDDQSLSSESQGRKSNY